MPASFPIRDALFGRSGLVYEALRKEGAPSEYTHVDGLRDLLTEFDATEDAEERAEIAALLKRVLGYGDLDLVSSSDVPGLAQWGDARVGGKRRVSILVLHPGSTRDRKSSAVLQATGALLTRMEQEEIPWGLLGDGLWWRLHSRRTALPAAQTLEVDVRPLLESAEERSVLAALSLLAAGSAREGGLWDTFLLQEERLQEAEAQAWKDLLQAAGSPLPALALWCETAGLVPRTPFLDGIREGGRKTTLLDHARWTLAQTGLEETEEKISNEKHWLPIAKELADALQTGRAEGAILSSLLSLASGMDLAMGDSLTPFPPSLELRRILRRGAAVGEPARIFLAGVPSLSAALEVLFSETSRGCEEGLPLDRSLLRATENFFAGESGKTLKPLRALVSLSSRALGVEAPYLSHRIKQGNPLASVPVSVLAETPASQKKKRGKGATRPGPRQISFVEALFMDRLATLATDLTLLAAAGPARLQSIEQQEGIFRRLLRGVERFRDLADLWLLGHLKKNAVGPSEYEACVSNLKTSDAEWRGRLAPYGGPLEDLRTRFRPFHWELEFPELYVEGGGPRTDPGFHLIVLPVPDAQTVRELSELRPYYQSLLPEKAAYSLLGAAGSLAALFRTNRGAVLTGPAGPTQ
ncbi:MAG: hypothetical protein AB1405_17865, partial [Bdellovibrionota bacterium]